MNWLTGFVVYFLIWWLVIFTTLSWGLRQPEKRPQGITSAAPDNINLLKKIIACSLISFVIWCGVYYLVRSDLISFRDAMQDEVL